MDTLAGPDSLNKRIRDGLSRVAAAMRSDDWQRARTAGLNPTQLSILELLAGRPSGMSVKDIASFLSVAQPTATDSIAALERKSLLTKRGARDDGRAVNVAITAQGLSAIQANDAQANDAPASAAERAVDALAAREQEDLLVSLVTMIRRLQEIDAIPIQRMCASCRYFEPFAHADAARPHHCHFVDAAFGRRELRIDCRDHETADPASRAATWDAFRRGSASIPPGS